MLKKAFALIALSAFGLFLGANAQSLVKKFNAIGTFTKIGNITFFQGEDLNGKRGIWKTDGTTGATTLVKAITVYIDAEYPSKIFAYNNKVYFSGSDGINGYELWQTDGTATGTVLLKNINTQRSGNDGSMPNNYILYKGLLYFTATEDSNQFSLWKTDGTTAGTVKVFDALYTGITQPILVGNTLYFTQNLRTLWKSDGTTAGTQQIPDDHNGSGMVEGLTNVNNELVFFTSENSQHDKVNLYKLNPTDNVQVKLGAFNAAPDGNNNISGITAVGNKFFFSIRTNDDKNGAADALWVSNGTAEGTVKLVSKPYEWYISGSATDNYIAYKGQVYFSAVTDHTLWTSDGTAGGTKQVSTIPLYNQVRSVVFNDKLYFSGNYQLCYFDGAKSGIEAQQPLWPSQFIDGGNQLYFQDSKYGVSSTLWSNAPAAQIQVSINNQPLSNSLPYRFSTKADSTVSAAVSVKNLGNKELVFADISVAGNSFYVNGTPERTLLPGQTAKFNLLYSPLKPEELTGKLIIKTNDNSGQTNFTNDLQGTAVGTATKNASAVADGLYKSIAFADSIPGFTLNQNTISETAALNTTIGTFALPGLNTPPGFELVAGTGDTDNGSFKIEGGQLKLATALNFDVRSTYTIRVKAGSEANAAEKVFSIQVTNTQAAPNPAACILPYENLAIALRDAVYVGTRIFAVGEQGKILVSEDDGKNWRAIKTGITSDLMRIRFTDNKTGYILASGSLLYKTEDGGENWFPLVSPSTSYPFFTSFHFISSTTGYLFGSGIYKTTDGGRSWQKCYTQYEALTDGWFIDENNGFVAGNEGSLQHTTDGGKTWETKTIVAGSSTLFRAVTFVNNTTGYIVNSTGTVMQTTDAGKTWAVISNVNTDGKAGQLYFVNANTGYFLTGFNSSTLYKTTDGGKTWAAETGIRAYSALFAVTANKTGDKLCLVGNGTGWGTSGEHGSVIMLKNGSADWEERSLTSNTTYNSGHLFASGVGYVIGGYSRKTTDGGITWKSLELPYNYFYVNSVKGYFINENVGFYTDYYHLYKTTDGAGNWKKVSRDSTSGIQRIYFVTPQIGYYNTFAKVYKTTDGGESWKAVLTPSGFNYINSISFPDEQTGYVSGVGSVLYKTSNGGSTWKKFDLGQDKLLISFGFFDAKIGMGGGTNGALYRTTDGGETWAPVYTDMRFTTNAFQFISPTHAYLLHTNGSGGVQQIYESADAGLTWNKIYETWENIFGLSYNNGHLFITGEAGTMLLSNSAPLPPVNAGYITGDTVATTGGKFIYSVPPVYNTKYQWLVSGAQKVEYQNDKVTVEWKNEGPHSLQVLPYNDCGNAAGRTLDVIVEDMPDPVLTGPDTAQSKSANVAYVATIHNGNTYSFAATNSTSVTSNANNALVSWDSPGMGTVTVVESNPKLGQRKSASLNVVIKEFKLPEDNFSILVNSATCKGSNNGFITVKAAQSLSYKATVVSPGGGTKDYSFTDSLKVANLAAGVYNICISVTGNAGYKRCYDANVTEPKDITLYTVVNPAAHTVTLNLSGADNYTIDINDKHYQTSSTQIDLPLTTGTNRLKVYSDKPCQGVIEKIVNLNKVTIYPNPFTDRVSIDLGGSTETNINVDITNAFGVRVYSKKQVNNGEPIEINTAGLNKGVYILTLTVGQTNAVFKIIKQ
ncbi:YCF48-related protein [Mucilaginibacter pedocola]|uniref:Cadherin domain-containing protein n=1 Tax=Mucilaginibacter pedocola TaxID=1792845 RepID=A0A1S9P695_9SPHI|nr:YCF48-related protein [Mucilaginibacter pedocola]OOQ56474.1 hypothetical protein BC343_18690 [Mucilaginibacter pedocola]